MVRKSFIRVAPLVALLCLAGCELFTVTPFPGFTDRTDISINLGSRIDSIAAGKSPISYDLTVVDDPLDPTHPRVLLLVEPPSSDPDVGFYYRGRLIFLDKDLTVVGQAATSTTDYFSKPYSYSADPGHRILAGYTVLDSSGGTFLTLTSPGLEGFAFTDGSDTYQFSTPAGQYAGFDISFIDYLPNWGVGGQGTLPIIPLVARPSTSDPNYANLGYQLVDLAYDSGSDTITFVLSEPAQGRIMAVRMDRGTAISGGTPLVNAASWPVSTSAWPMAVSADRPELHADIGGFFMIQRDGWMTRYNWTGGATLSPLGSPLQIVGDRSLNRHYAFLTSQTEGNYMYRFDPASRVLTRYKRWW